DEEFIERFDGVVGQPVVELLEGGFTGEHFEPGSLAFVGVGFVHRGVEHTLTRGPNVRSGAVAADKREDRVVRNGEFAILNGDFATGRRSDIFVGHNFQFTVSSSSIETNGGSKGNQGKKTLNPG